MKIFESPAFGSLDQRDRNLLLGCAAIFFIAIVVLAVFAPARDEEENRIPSTYSTTRHGAKAAYELLRKSGYRVDRQMDALSQLGGQVDEHTTLIIAEPFMQNVGPSQAAIKQVLNRGGHVLVTGMSGGLLVPESAADMSLPGMLAECDAVPEGFGDLANSGKVVIRPTSYWKQTNPLHRSEYTCDGKSVAVTYGAGKGSVTWWANSLPLENAGIERADNLVFFLNSVAPPQTTRVLWDESLHGAAPSLWSHTSGTPVHLIWGQLAFIALLLILSFGRRSGPLRPDPVISRAAPIEFVRSLGSLYQKAGATTTAVAISLQRFRLMLERLSGISHTLSADSPAMLQALTQRFGAHAAGRIQHDLLACEQGTADDEQISARGALVLMQALHDHESRMHPRTSDSGKSDTVLQSKTARQEPSLGR